MAHDLDSENAKRLVGILMDPSTPSSVSVQVLDKLLESSKEDNFFKTLYEEDLSKGPCPECGHENHWLTPETDLNRMGWVSHIKDDRVKRITTVEDCPRYQECCSKKKISI